MIFAKYIARKFVFLVVKARQAFKAIFPWSVEWPQNQRCLAFHFRLFSV